jgi:ParB/RepB/Spo0J family partition protein
MPDIKNSNVRNVPLKLIEPNPKNPRLIFDQEELDRLIESIKNRGMLVPLNVFLNEKKKFTIIDGERRYKASLQLGLKTLPVIINKKPHKEDYALDMFHIHNLLEPWELLPTALKLKEVTDLFKKNEGREPKE